MDEVLKELELEGFLFKPRDESVSDNVLVPDIGSQSQIFFEDKEPVRELTEDPQVEKKVVWQDDGEIIPDEHLKHSKMSASTNLPQETIKTSEYEEQLRRRHRSLYGQADWAELPSNKQKGSRLDVLSSADPLIVKGRGLRKGIIEVNCVADANQNDPSQYKLASMGYDSDGKIFMTATQNGKISLFHIDGTQNPIIDEVKIRNFKTIQAGFLPKKEQILVIGSPQFQSAQILDLESKKAEVISRQNPRDLFQNFALGNEPGGNSELVAFVTKGGLVPVYSLTSRRWITQLQSNRAIEAAAFSGNNIYTSSVGGKINIWDIRTFRCVSEFIDEGTLHCTAMKFSRKGEYLATGSNSGVVNIYNAKYCSPDSVTSSNPKPLKTVLNLKTEIDTLEFHPSSQASN